ncbi:type VI secretion system accessory protein TagJ [Halioxenophilus aromaticivorans]|uniref:Virulence protein SciE type n=1 Tax=Halioxenophilus aromaticivorans TaxID=1306992 RepID=A0AAV3U2V4_9ALTE
MNPKQAYQDGDLSQAMTLAAEVVKQNPSDVTARVFFAELCCIVGDLERADKQLQTLITLAPELVLTASNWRQLIRAAYARNSVYQEGATPTLVAPPSPDVERALHQLVALHNNFLETETTDSDENSSPANVVFTVNQSSTAALRDLDDLNADILEFLGTNGNYFWVELSQIESLHLETPERPLDLLWRKCRLITNGGSDGVVFMPTIYPNTSDDTQQLLGRSTDWVNRNGLELGLGLREFLVGDEVLSIMDLKSLVRA